ncbi:unnamed protein product, partial [Rotaria magnacalcarata]
MQECTNKRKSFLESQYTLQSNSKELDDDCNSPDLANDRTSVSSKVTTWFRRVGAKICGPKCTNLLIGMLIGSLVGGIALAATLTMMLTPGS